MEPISRRRALQLGGLGLLSSAVGGVGLWQVTRGGSRLDPGTGSTFAEPEVLASRDGLLELTLEAAAGSHQVAGRTATTLAYNGTVPGPTLWLRPGDRVRLTLVNEMTEPTNLHVHGLHVSPEDNADNVFLRIGPGESFDYEYQLPDDHPPGVYWYHPHLHHTVADQLFAGLYGAIVVEDPEEIPVTRERLLVVGDTTLDSSGRVVQVSRMEQMMGREGDLVLVNGQVDPVVRARPGERERWRVVNACSSRFLSLRLDGQQVHLLGKDSGRLPSPREVDEVLLAPGNRADLLVTTRPGTSALEALPYDRGGMMGMRGGPFPGSDEPVRLATVEVEGDTGSTPADLPPQPAPRDLRSGPVDRTRQLVFEMGMMGMRGPGGAEFLIDGRTFDAGRVDQRVELGSVEEWTIVNDSPMDHPFHLHVWPMQVLEENREPVDDPTWQDVVNVPAFGQVTVRLAFETFGGKTVYHCHILDHEDLGMMGVVRAE